MGNAEGTMIEVQAMLRTVAVSGGRHIRGSLMNHLLLGRVVGSCTVCAMCGMGIMCNL